MNRDLTQGPVTKSMLLFALPMILGNLLQQCLGGGGLLLHADDLPHLHSAGDVHGQRGGVLHPLWGGRPAPAEKQPVPVLFADWRLYRGPECGGVFAHRPHDGAASGAGGRHPPDALLPVGDFLGHWGHLPVQLLCQPAAGRGELRHAVFVVAVPWGVAGAAFATSFSQWVSGVGLLVYTWKRMAHLRPSRQDVYWKKDRVGEIARFSLLTCVQQSVMNFGILMVQGLVNSFGTVVMAAFAAAVKIDSFAYMPVQDFGNAFSTFIAQNYGARDMGRIRRGIRSAVLAAAVFSGAVSVLVCVFAEPLLLLFVKPEEREILAVGVQYLRVEGAFYVGIGILFLLYGLYRAIQRPGMSLVLTVISLGTRVALAYALSAIPAIGVVGIWWSVPIGWALADVAGVVYYKRNRDRLLRPQQPQKGANP